MLIRLCKLCAIVAGLFIVAIMTLTCLSLTGRNTIGLTLVGDFEITGIIMGVSVAWFMPYCQWRRGHIGVDFFTSGLSLPMQTGLDRLGSLLLAGFFLLLAWRTGWGAFDAYESHSSTMMINCPEWIVYAAMIPPMLLTSLVGAFQCLGWIGMTPQTQLASLGEG